MTQSNDPNIVLTGFMGTGKTTVGRLLAEQLGYEFVDTDHLIEQAHGPINDIFATQGEDAFRALERTVAQDLAERRRLVVATGGRMMLDPANVAALSRNGRVFCLVASPDEILERVVSDVAPLERPLLAVPDPAQRIAELLAQRAPAYRRFAQLGSNAQPPKAIAALLAATAQADPHRIAVNSPNGSYEICVGVAILPLARQLADIRGPIIIVTSQDAAENYLASCPSAELVITLPHGFGHHKSHDIVQGIHNQLVDAGVDQTATIMSLGDSAVADIAGLTASTYLGGLDLVHCPTSLAAMLGNTTEAKAVPHITHDPERNSPPKQPKAAIADLATLQTTEADVFASELAEVLQLGLTADPGLLANLENEDWSNANQHALDASTANLQTLVTHAMQAKASVMPDHPAWSGQNPQLELGHGFGDAIEKAIPGRLLRGQALALGLVASARLSELAGVAPHGLTHRVRQVVQHLNLPTVLPHATTTESVLKAMGVNPERHNEQTPCALLADVGAPSIVKQVSSIHMVQALESIQPQQ